MAGKTVDEYETYLLGEVEEIKTYIKSKADPIPTGTAANTAMKNIEEALLANNDAFKGEFGRDSDAVKDLEPVSRKKTGGKSKDPRDPEK